jgi:protease-4
MWSSLHDYTPAEWARFEAWLDRVYDDFTSKVAAGRKLPKEKVLEIAKGRIWTGEDARARGLVDDLGGYPLALRLAREAAGLPPDAAIRLRVFPAPKSLLEAAIERLRGDGDASENDVARALLTASLDAAQPLVALGRRLGRSSGPLAMPDLGPALAW